MGSAGGQAGRGAQQKTGRPQSLHLFLGSSLSSAILTVVSQEGTFTRGLRVCVCVHTCVQMCVSHKCACICMYTWAHVCVGMYLCTSCAHLGVNVQPWKHNYAGTGVHPHVPVLCEHTHVHACTRTRTHTFVCGRDAGLCVCVSLREYLCDVSCVCGYVSVYTHACVHVYVCAHVSVYLCMCMNV